MADPISILFVGNSYTFGRVDPVMSYNAANVHDLTAGVQRGQPGRRNPWEPHPVGRRAGHLQGVHRAGRPRLRRLDLGAQRGVAARPVPQHRQRRLGPARQRRVADLGRGRAAGAERRGAAAGQGQERQLPHLQRLRRTSSSASSTTAPRRPTPRRSSTAAWRACKATGPSTTTCNTRAHDPAEPQRERRDQGLPDRDLGAARHGVRPQDHRRRHRPRPTARRSSTPASAGGDATLYYAAWPA